MTNMDIFKVESLAKPKSQQYKGYTIEPTEFGRFQFYNTVSGIDASYDGESWSTNVKEANSIQECQDEIDELTCNVEPHFKYAIGQEVWILDSKGEDFIVGTITERKVSEHGYRFYRTDVRNRWENEIFIH